MFSLEGPSYNKTCKNLFAATGSLDGVYISLHVSTDHRNDRQGGVTMDRVVETIYEQGSLKPLEALDLPEPQRVRITIHDLPPESPDAMLDAWHQV